MTSDLIDAALLTATDTRAVDFGRGAVERAGALFARTFPGTPALVVADGNTWEAVGEQVTASLAAAGVEVLEPFVFPGRPTLYADYSNVVPLRDHLAATSASICAIGSGTLNDLCKLASGELDRGYLVVCTAASQDGYAAFGASITRDGFKITRTCPAPAALSVDLDVLVASYHGMPKRYLMEGDPYHCQCQKTSRLLRERLGWEAGAIDTSFQSVFGRRKRAPLSVRSSAPSVALY